MDVVKLWSNLLANCAIAPSAPCSMPTAYFVQGTPDVQIFSFINNNNNNNDDVNNCNNEEESLDASNCSKGDANFLTVQVKEENISEEEEDGEDEYLEREADEEEEDINEDEDESSLTLRDNSPASAKEARNVAGTSEGEQKKATTEGKQTQTKIHRNRYSREEYRCSMCPYTCTTEKAFLKHSRNCEPNEQDTGGDKHSISLSCPICGKDRRGEDSLALHMTKHRDNRHFCCDICKFKTLQLKKLIQHRRMHTGEKPHLCPFCSYRSARRDNLRSHARRVHKEENLPCDTFTPRSMILRPRSSVK